LRGYLSHRGDDKIIKSFPGHAATVLRLCCGFRRDQVC